MSPEELLAALECLIDNKYSSTISAMNAISVDELMDTVERFKKVPTFEELQKENNRLQKERQKLVRYLKDKINECRLVGNDTDYLKIDVYEEILYIINEEDKYE